MIIKGRIRTPRTKEMLLPLPPSIVRNISLEKHLALVTIRSGNGVHETVIVLLRVLYMSYFLLDEATEEDLEPIRQVEIALQDSIVAAARSIGWRLCEDSLPLIERMLIRFDEVVRSVPKYRYVEAMNRMGEFSSSDDQSPLPGSRANGVWK